MDFETLNLNAMKVYKKLKEIMNNVQVSEQLLQVYTQLLNEGKRDEIKGITDVLKKSIEGSAKIKDAMASISCKLLGSSGFLSQDLQKGHLVRVHLYCHLVSETSTNDVPACYVSKGFIFELKLTETNL
ncbi:hypothetical protein TNCT_497391 [Trichonephila clavata]|uniref:Uncharacterized protein n=1 Tax=Trichonephila clavata TaxID=2740835 RepID=A0A8X6KX42_TRICU|nr:hypothetical protein TNCT_497391 [Trichonephila clavata]